MLIVAELMESRNFISSSATNFIADYNFIYLTKLFQNV
jgi:hypothetical protein